LWRSGLSRFQPGLILQYNGTNRYVCQLQSSGRKRMLVHRYTVTPNSSVKFIMFLSYNPHYTDVHCIPHEPPKTFLFTDINCAPYILISYVLCTSSTLPFYLPHFEHYVVFLHSHISSGSHACRCSITPSSRRFKQAIVPSQHIKCLCALLVAS
jgi:hypothetical protein